jgi:hypothetical protein
MEANRAVAQHRHRKRLDAVEVQVDPLTRLVINFPPGPGMLQRDGALTYVVQIY